MKEMSYVTEVWIDRSPEEVFEFCSDLRNEKAWNADIESVDKLTDGPVGIGTRFQATWSNTGPVIVDVVEFDRPRSWETRSRAGGLEFITRGTVDELDSGSRYQTTLRIRAKGLARLYAPLALSAMRRREPDNLAQIKRTIESGATSPARPRR